MRKSSQVQSFVNDVKTILQLPVAQEHKKLVLAEYPFDAQMLTLSPLYYKSRKLCIA